MTITKQNKHFDVAIIGGGINGVGIAAEAAQRGLKVFLCEQGDLGSGTSSKSSKLIHGGLRYLEHFEFRLVKEALGERDVLLKKAPHITWPLRFFLPYSNQYRPKWLIRLGLFLYDHLASRQALQPSRSHILPQNSPLKLEFNRGFEYSDVWVDDSRLVILNAIQARDHAAEIRTRTKCTSAKRQGDQWLLALEGDKGEKQLTAQVLINAAGPFVSVVDKNVIGAEQAPNIRLVKGSHLVVPKLYQSEQAFIFQNEDKRVVFVLPYEKDFTLVGTTDVDASGSDDVEVSQAEVDYLLALVNRHFNRSVSESDIVHKFAGVRPLLFEQEQAAQAVSRDYKVMVDAAVGAPPVVTIVGGKITTYRKLAESTVDKLERFFPSLGPSRSAELPLAGGDFANKAELDAKLQLEFSFLPEGLRSRFVRTYGTLCFEFLMGTTSLAELGEDFGAGLYEAEVRYLIDNEWAMTADDVLWRRSKLGLRLTGLQMNQLQQFIQDVLREDLITSSTKCHRRV